VKDLGVIGVEGFVYQTPLTQSKTRGCPLDTHYVLHYELPKHLGAQ